MLSDVSFPRGTAPADYDRDLISAESLLKTLDTISSCLTAVTLTMHRKHRKDMSSISAISSGSSGCQCQLSVNHVARQDLLLFRDRK